MRALLITALVTLGACSDVEPGAQVQSRRVEATRGPVEALAVLTPARPTAGERMRLQVDVTAATGVTMHSPLISVEAEEIGPFNVLQSQQQPDVPLPDGRRSWSQTLVLDTYETGALELPALRMAFDDERGSPTIEGFVTLPIIEVTVASALAEGEDQLRAMRDERPLPVGPASPWWWLALPATLAALVGAVLWARRGAAAALTPLTPAQRARRDLARLDQDDLLDQGGIEQYLARVADIVRRYLEDGLGLRAPRATTREFLAEAEHSSVLGANHRASLHQLLALADLVKFARHAPATDAGTQAMSTARAFVDATDQPVEAEPAGGAA